MSTTKLDQLLNEKHRPNTLDEYIFQDGDVERKMRRWVEQGSIPNVLLVGKQGTGKCLGKGTPVLMFDGSVKPVEEIEVGDFVMGPDSTPRKVESTCTGSEMMYEVKPSKGMSYTVNESHVLSLRESGKDMISNMTISEYNSLSNWKKSRMMGWRTPISFTTSHISDDMIPPYILGVWLGDGTSNRPDISSCDEEVLNEWRFFADSVGLRTTEYDKNGCKTSRIVGDVYAGGKKNKVHAQLCAIGVINNKHIPFTYQTSSDDDRLELLAGILDTDGYLDRKKGYDIVVKQEKFANDIAFVARSLGFSAYVKECTKTIKSIDYFGTYYRLSICGDVSRIPCRVERRKASPRSENAKNVLNVGITVTPIGVDEYYGFSVDKDHLFVLGDFTVTHNSSAAWVLVNELGIDHNDVMVVNGSTQGIGYIRDVVEPWVAKASMSKFKIVLIEEGDALPPKAQKSLRMITEESSDHVRWIITANYEASIIPPLLSRFEAGYIRLDEMSYDGVIDFISDIIDKENIIVTDEHHLLAHIDAHQPDIRKIINSIDGGLDSNNVLHPPSSVSTAVEQDQWKELWVNGDVSLDACLGLTSLIDQSNFEWFYQVMYENSKQFPQQGKGIVLCSQYLDRALTSANQRLHLDAFLYELWMEDDDS